MDRMGLNKRNLFLRVLQAEKSKNRLLANSVSQWGLFLVFWLLSSWYVLPWQREFSEVASYKDTNPILMASSSWPHLNLIISQRPLSKHHHLGSMASSYEFWKDIISSIKIVFHGKAQRTHHYQGQREGTGEGGMGITKGSAEALLCSLAWLARLGWDLVCWQQCGRRQDLAVPRWRC